jgi:hypothetical protein
MDRHAMIRFQHSDPIYRSRRSNTKFRDEQAHYIYSEEEIIPTATEEIHFLPIYKKGDRPEYSEYLGISM